MRGVAAPYDAAMHLPVALVQLDARADVTANIAAAVALADEAAAGGARLVALPEYLPRTIVGARSRPCPDPRATGPLPSAECPP